MNENMNAVIYALQYGGDRDQAELRAIAKELIVVSKEAIAAAVQAEREACAKMAEQMPFLREHEHYQMIISVRDADIAAAIRARSGAQEERTA